MRGRHSAGGGVMTCRNTTGVADPDACSKYCTDHPFTTECDVCGELVETTYGSGEVIGHVHSGDCEPGLPTEETRP